MRTVIASCDCGWTRTYSSEAKAESRLRLHVCGVCGTYGGFQAHRKRGDAPCEACNEAYVQYMRDLRLSKGVGRQFNYPTEVRPELLDMPSLGARIAQSFRESA